MCVCVQSSMWYNIVTDGNVEMWIYVQNNIINMHNINGITPAVNRATRQKTKSQDFSVYLYLSNEQKKISS